jgi:DNA mismatch repair protein MutS2
MTAIYPDNFETKIGFDRIREILRSRCTGSPGEENVDRMDFVTEHDVLQTLLGETDEFLRIVKEFPAFPADPYFDVRDILHNVRAEGSFMEKDDLFHLKQTLDTLRSVVHFFDRDKERIMPQLYRKAWKIRIYPYVYERIDQILNKSGEIRDDASPELSSIRGNIRSLQSGISKRLQAILKQAQKEGWAEENASVAIRDGRAVIPVPSANKRKLQGIIYDESSSGRTTYIEPADIVEMNNRIRELENEERREIIRILVVFCNNIRPYIDDLIGGIEFLGEIDFIRTKALFAKDFKCIKPDISAQPLIDWKEAVHPLLMLSLKKESRKIVPLDITLTQENHILVISGPNAGGKSVCLKTVGLLQYMLQSGLLIPVAEGSRTGMFRKIFVDIGDEQSIENDLSTYSSHLLNMKYFVRNSDANSLVLIDEFGSGTEPVLGGAIAEAVLNRLNQQNVFCVVTTHYSNLKHFAASTPGIINGAMMYDSGKMDPLFRLETGKPGSSFAFEIARKIGLPEDILQEAAGKVGKKQVDFDRNLRSITRDKFYWETKRQRIRQVEKSVDELAEAYRKELEEIQKHRKEILKKAKEEAEQILSGANRKIENVIREIREKGAEKEQTKEIRRGLETFREQILGIESPGDALMEKKMSNLEKREKRRLHKLGKEQPGSFHAKEEQKTNFLAGDKVRKTGHEAVGEIIEVSGKNAIVAFGQLRAVIPLKEIEPAVGENPEPLPKRTKSGLAITLEYSERRLNFKPEIDLRGVRAEEALTRVQSFLDEAVMFGVSHLRILHGKGHGILKEMIRNYLRSEPVVTSFGDEDVRLGGAGITVVELDI